MLQNINKFILYFLICLTFLTQAKSTSYGQSDSDNLNSNSQAGLIQDCENCSTPQPQLQNTLIEINTALNERKLETIKSIEQKIKKYSESTEVKNMINWVTKNNSKFLTGAGSCYRKVKEALALKCGLRKKNLRPCRNVVSKNDKTSKLSLMNEISGDLKDFYARSAKDRLKESGFINLLEIEPFTTKITSPSLAPKGSVLVYSSGVPCNVTFKRKVVATTDDCGHIEIKTGDVGEKGYASDYYSDYAINETPRAQRNGSNYKLIGVMIKP